MKKCIFALCKNAPRSSHSWFSPPRKHALVLTHSLGEILIAVHFNVVFKISRWLFPDYFHSSHCRHDFIPWELMLSHTPGVESLIVSCVGRSYSHPDLLLTQWPTSTPLFRAHRSSTNIQVTVMVSLKKIGECKINCWWGKGHPI